jgi:hypothetical protein
VARLLKPWRPNALRDLLIRIEKPMTTRRNRRPWHMTPAQRVRMLRYIVIAAGAIGFVGSYDWVGLPETWRSVASGVAWIAGLLLGKPLIEVLQQAIRMPERTPPPETLTEAAKIIGEGE